MVNHKDKLELVLSLGNRYTQFLVHSRDALLRTMKVGGHAATVALLAVLLVLSSTRPTCPQSS